MTFLEHVVYHKNSSGLLCGARWIWVLFRLQGGVGAGGIETGAISVVAQVAMAYYHCAGVALA